MDEARGSTVRHQVAAGITPVPGGALPTSPGGSVLRVGGRNSAVPPAIITKAYAASNAAAIHMAPSGGTTGLLAPVTQQPVPDRRAANARLTRPPPSNFQKPMKNQDFALWSLLERPQSDVETPKPFWIDLPSIFKANLPPTWPQLGSQNPRKSLKNQCQDAWYFAFYF